MLSNATVIARQTETVLGGRVCGSRPRADGGTNGGVGSLAPLRRLAQFVTSRTSRAQGANQWHSTSPASQ